MIRQTLIVGSSFLSHTFSVSGMLSLSSLTEPSLHVKKSRLSCWRSHREERGHVEQNGNIPVGPNCQLSEPS